VCWLSIAAIVRQPSILRNLICPLTTRLKSRFNAASSLGREPCVFTRRRVDGVSAGPGQILGFAQGIVASVRIVEIEAFLAILADLS